MDTSCKINQGAGTIDQLSSMTFVQKELLHDNYGGDKMQVEKAPQFIRKEDVLEHGIEKFKILTESKLNEGTYGTELVCEIYAIRKDGNKERAKWRINDKTRSHLIDKVGKDTSEWIGKELNITIDNKSIIGTIQ